MEGEVVRIIGKGSIRGKETNRGVQYAGNDFKTKFKTREETKRKVFSPFEYEKQTVLTL